MSKTRDLPTWTVSHIKPATMLRRLADLIESRTEPVEMDLDKILRPLVSVRGHLIVELRMTDEEKEWTRDESAPKPRSVK